jgi:hypothetical protein
MTFPVFKFNEENVPVGDSAKLCMGLSWVPIKKRNQYDKYLDVKGFNECELHASGRANWEPDFPINGLNFKIWDQFQKKGDSTCKQGIYVEKIDMCFTYKIMKQICVLVKFQKDVSKNTYSWITTGGCYKDNKAVLYEDAYPGDIVNFKDVQFEVRMDKR